MKKVSLICTLFNEEKNVKYFMNSIVNQNEKPGEFIIIDGGSKDKTYPILKNFSKKYKWIKVFQVKGANISKGRNYAIKKSKNEIIAVCDAGGEYRRDWLKKLVGGFNGKVSFGIDKPRIRNNFQKVLAKKILRKNTPGSSRNMIFSKKIWKEVGGYPEDIERAEDTLFDERIKKAGYKISRVEGAICFWEMRENLEEVKKQFSGYGYWDGVSHKKHGMLPGRYKVLIFLMFFTFPLYPLFWIFSKFSLGSKIVFERRYSYFFGFIKGYFVK